MKIKNINYPDFSMDELMDKTWFLPRYLQLSAEFGQSKEGKKIYDEFMKELDNKLSEFQRLVLSATDPDEPDSLEKIKELRPDGPRRLSTTLPSDYGKRLRGAFYGRMAGCTLGAALEFRSVEEMKLWAEYNGDQYPLENYWSRIQSPYEPHYIVGQKIDLTKDHMDAVPPDDDTIYTLLGLLTLEKHGLDFTLNDMADVWKTYLPLGEESSGKRGCYWGERVMLKNMLAGVPFPEAGLNHNPNLQNIAAWTRADAFGYAVPGWPEKAAELAYKDASANHRRNGVYGSMFMAATISAAFVVDDPVEAVRIGLTEIPRNCLFAEGIRWALDNIGNYHNYEEAANLVWSVYDGMFNGSALTNALHVVMGLVIAGQDFTKAIGETIAMSGDNDCTGATAGSIMGAVIGIDNIPEQWIKPFRGRMHIYLNQMPEYLEIESVCKRFEALAERFV